MDINVNYFVMKAADNNIVVPNKQIVENPFKNYSLTTKIRVTINCGITYNSDIENIKKSFYKNN